MSTQNTQLDSGEWDDLLQRVKEWQRAMGQPVDANNLEWQKNQTGYYLSEFAELAATLAEPGIERGIWLEALSDDIGDVAYTALGLTLADVYGLDRHSAVMDALYGIVLSVFAPKKKSAFQLLREIVEEVCRSNETKFWSAEQAANGAEIAGEPVIVSVAKETQGGSAYSVRRASNQKVVKPPTFEPPNFKKILEEAL